MSSGGLILVVGPSGAGKDSLLRAAMTHFAADPRFVFPRRVITRMADAAAEDHDSLSLEDFEARLLQGAFALHWQAHGLHYGVRSSICGDIKAGRCVVVNASRGILAGAMSQFPRLAAVEITAPQEVLLARLSARRRRADGNLAQRVARKSEPYPPGLNLLSISNDASLEQAEMAFVQALDRLQRKISSQP